MWCRSVSLSVENIIIWSLISRRSLLQPFVPRQKYRSVRHNSNLVVPVSATRTGLSTLMNDVLVWSTKEYESFTAKQLRSLICLVMTYIALLVLNHLHYDDVIMGVMASQMTSLTIVYSTVYSGADQRKHQSSTSLAFVWGIHWGPVNSPHKWPVTRNFFSIWWRHHGMCIEN